jgi:hypothetical protein
LRTFETQKGGPDLRKYVIWTYLNAEGKALWGDIFPDSEVPIQSLIPQSATLEGIEDQERVFLLNWQELTAQQQKAILEKISKKSGASKESILKEILRVGLPLRAKYTEGCGTIRIGFFI